MHRERQAALLKLADIVEEHGHLRLTFRHGLPAEEWNAQISLLTGMAAASLMVDAEVGLLRTLPEADPRDVAELRRTAKGFRIPWPAEWSHAEFIASLDPGEPSHQAMTAACTKLLRGSGYHAWRMAGAGAAFVLVIDPSPRFFWQFRAVRHFVGDADGGRTHFLPVGIEEVPAGLGFFDTVFSMGVLYHRPSPLEHLLQLKDALRPGGELVLETLVVEGDATTVLLPGDRYAAMPNVYFLPSSAALCQWLDRCGLINVRVVDEAVTTTDEQRTTEWMTFQSLADFLDPHDPSKTREGYPAPRRAVVMAERPR